MKKLKKYEKEIKEALAETFNKAEWGFNFGKPHKSSKEAQDYILEGKRQFQSGANRNSDIGKLDYEAFNAPIVDWYYAQYMHSHRKLEDGTLRDGDNWQKGFPIEVITKSLARHYKDYHLTTRGIKVLEKGKEMKLEDILCGIIFNAKAHLLELLKDRKEVERDFIG